MRNLSPNSMVALGSLEFGMKYALVTYIFWKFFTFIFCRIRWMVHGAKSNNAKSINSSLLFNQSNHKYQNISVSHFDEMKDSNFQTMNNECCYHQNAFAFNNVKSIEWNVLLCMGLKKYILIFHPNGCFWLLGKITFEIWSLGHLAFRASIHIPWDFNTLLCTFLHMFNVRRSNTITIKKIYISSSHHVSHSNTNHPSFAYLNGSCASQKCKTTFKFIIHNRN